MSYKTNHGYDRLQFQDKITTDTPGVTARGVPFQGTKGENPGVITE